MIAPKAVPGVLAFVPFTRLLPHLGFVIGEHCESIFVRLPDIILILLSLTIVVLAGFGPLLGSHGRHDGIPQECQMFYGAAGSGAVAHCMTEMAQHTAASR